MTTLRTELHGDGRLDIIIAAPPVNAFSSELLRELSHALISVPSEARVVVLRAEGPGFSAGGDVKEMKRLDGNQGIIRQIRDGLQACVAVEQCPVPVIAAVQGYVVGIGALVVGVCDMIIAAEGSRFIFAEVDNGAASGVIQGLRLLPEKRLRAAMFTGEPVPVEDLLVFGSVHAVVPHARLIDEAETLAAKICAKSPAVVRAMKESINRTLDRDLVGKYRAEASYTYELHLSGDAQATREALWKQ